jgi:hypothetical protein
MALDIRPLSPTSRRRRQKEQIRRLLELEDLKKSQPPMSSTNCESQPSQFQSIPPQHNTSHLHAQQQQQQFSQYSRPLQMPQSVPHPMFAAFSQNHELKQAPESNNNEYEGGGKGNKNVIINKKKVKNYENTTNISSGTIPFVYLFGTNLFSFWLCWMAYNFCYGWLLPALGNPFQQLTWCPVVDDSDPLTRPFYRTCEEARRFGVGVSDTGRIAEGFLLGLILFGLVFLLYRFWLCRQPRYI